jgi:hypothetical protein
MEGVALPETKSLAQKSKGAGLRGWSLLSREETPLERQLRESLEMASQGKWGGDR